MTVEISLPSLADVRAAAARIAPHIHRTPLLRCATFERELGATLYWKAENLQKVGAFKARGALNAVLCLGEDAARAGVITHSSGNHAAALANAARIRGVPCVVVMPRTAPRVKVDAVKGYGAEVVPCEISERASVCSRIAGERGMTVVHPFENEHVMAGAGTVALELIEDVPDVDMLVVPVGGGGLAAGTALVGRALLPDVSILLAEPEAVDDAARSLSSGVLQPRVEDATTWSDGLMTGLGAPNFAALTASRVEVQTVSEEETLRAALDLMQRLKTVVEPSAATVLAALRARRGGGAWVEGARIGVVLSGGNTDFRWLSALPQS